MDQVLSWDLPLPAAPLSESACAARRLLGQIGRFSPVENTKGKAVVSLETYVDMIQKANLSDMGLA